jgi:valyl-tRNA synthetase
MKLDKNYEPAKYESNIYQKWLDHDSFKATNKSKDYFSIVLPPPNANASLHLGQNLTVAIEDISARFNRMKGRDTLFLPGADHGGFETWVVYEKKLNQQGRTRFDFTNKQLYDQVWDFVDENKHNVLSQLKRMGMSADWNQFTYTLDKKVVNQAYETFKKMWDEKLIYRGERIVNYCTFHGTSFSDIEVTYKNQKGKLWYLKYPIKDSEKYITVATTRPETILGDVAVAVNPKDKRFENLVGKTVILPIQNREIPIIADNMVESDFGTGAVKITPAHDVNDFELAQRNKLPMISVIDTKGEIYGQVPKKYLGLKVDEAREKIVKDLETLNLVDKVEDYSNRVGHCYKCHTIIQPLLSKQWFVKMRSLAKEAIVRLENKQINFYPKSKLNQSIEYLNNIRDWNISRQIPWGIPIPAWQNQSDPEDWIYDERVDKDEITVDGLVYKRDPDVFDTWFSSGQWPYTTLGYPNSSEFKKFYPLTLMDTGGEILYPWVCRMIMLGVYITGDVPFKNVYIHGHVMAQDGSKMSKSLGNVINPIELIDKYGSDAVRIGLIIGRTAGVNRGYDPRKIEEGRNFANKLWNIARFIEAKVDLDFKYTDEPNLKTIQDKWIVNGLMSYTNLITKLLENYRYSEAFDAVYRFVWNDFADWYVEASKTETNLQVLCFVFNNILKLVHPFAPFVTETIWQNFGWNKGQYLAVTEWPKLESKKKPIKIDFDKLINLVEELRFIRATLGNKIKINILTDDKIVISNEKLLKNLAKINLVEATIAGKGLKLQSLDNVWVDLSEDGLVSFISSLTKQKSNLEVTLRNLELRLKNKSYLEKAPKNLINETKKDLDKTKTNLEDLDKQIKNFL